METKPKKREKFVSIVNPRYIFKPKKFTARLSERIKIAGKKENLQIKVRDEQEIAEIMFKNPTSRKRNKSTNAPTNKFDEIAYSTFSTLRPK